MALLQASMASGRHDYLPYLLENYGTGLLESQSRTAADDITLSSPRKRKRPKGEGDNEHDTLHTSRKSSQPTPQQQQTEGSSPFACPYYKKDPRQHWKCSNYEAQHIRHLKQHIRRKHEKPEFCPRCGITFSSADSRNTHIRQIICQISTALVEPDGITSSQQKALSRRVSSTLARDEQWYSVFDIVCPGHSPRPASPYREQTLCESTLACIREQGPRIFLDTLRREDAWPSGLDFSLLEPVLRRTLRSTIDQFATQSGREALRPDDPSELSHSSLGEQSGKRAEAESGFIAQIPQRPAAYEFDEATRAETSRNPPEAEGNGITYLPMPDDLEGFAGDLAGAREPAEWDLYLFAEYV